MILVSHTVAVCTHMERPVSSEEGDKKMAWEWKDSIRPSLCIFKNLKEMWQKWELPFHLNNWFIGVCYVRLCISLEVWSNLAFINLFSLNRKLSSTAMGLLLRLPSSCIWTNAEECSEQTKHGRLLAWDEVIHRAPARKPPTKRMLANANRFYRQHQSRCF